MRLPKRLGVREIRLSLQTENPLLAIKRIEQLTPYVDQLKQLVISPKSLETSQIKPKLLRIKDAMLKQLQIKDIDLLIADLEADYSNNGHLLNVLGETPLLGDDNRFKDELVYIAQSADNEERAVRLNEVIAGLTQEDKWPFLDVLSSMVKILIDMTDENDFETEGTEVLARQLLTQQGFQADSSSLAFKILVSKLTTSNKMQLDLVRSILGGDAFSERQVQSLLKTRTHLPEVTTPVEEVSPTTPLFSEVYSEFLSFKIKKEKLSMKMQQDYERRYAVWVEVMPDKPIGDYRAKDIGYFIDTCFELPKMHVSPYNKMSWSERLNCDVPEEDLQAPKSVQQYYKWLQGIFAYAKKDTVGYIESSPCTIKRDFSANIRGIFSDIELKRFIEYVSAERQAWKKWIIYLGIYTGARRGELVQIQKSDVRMDEETGRYYLLITDEHETQQLKTDNAKRKIPLHQDLINAGFIDFVDGCQSRIFNELDSAKPVTAWFPRLRETLELPYINDLGHTRSFHSFRHTFITKLMNIDGMNINLLQQVVGHELSKFGITSNYTHKLDSLKNLLPVVDAYKLE